MSLLIVAALIRRIISSQQPVGKNSIQGFPLPLWGQKTEWIPDLIIIVLLSNVKGISIWTKPVTKAFLLFSLLIFKEMVRVCCVTITVHKMCLQEQVVYLETLTTRGTIFLYYICDFENSCHGNKSSYKAFIRMPFPSHKFYLPSLCPCPGK